MPADVDSLIHISRFWRAVVLVLLMVAFSGPWAFDRIHVPMPYECHRPNIRLNENFCGIPVTFVTVIHMLLISLPEMLLRTFSRDSGPNLLFIFIVFLFMAVPILSLALIWRGTQSRLRLALIAVLPITIVIGIIYTLAIMPRFHPALWGVYLYIFVAFVLFLVELLVYRHERRNEDVAVLAGE
jgi:hypothetical protein